MKTILVLNMGMKSIRSIVFDSDGNKLASYAMPITTSLSDEYVTQEPDEWWDKAQKVISRTISDLHGYNIDYLTVTTSAACLVYVDKEGYSLGPCHMVSDKRAKKQSAEMERAASFQRVKKEVGLGADPYLMIPKILWIKENQPDIYEHVYKFISSNDFLISRFTGQYVTDYLNAQKYHYNSDTHRYPEALLKELGIDKDKLPEVGDPGMCIGNISMEAAKATGLSSSVKVVMSSYDAMCSFIGSGVCEQGEASDVSGTVTVFRALSRDKIQLKTDKIQQIPYYQGNMNIIGGSNNLGGGLIEWVKQCYYQNEQLPYEIMEKDAGEAPLGAGGVIFLPYLLGERTPIWDYDARGVFFGLERMHTRKEMTRAVFESTGFIDLDMINAIEENGLKVNKIRISGGLARLNLISQMKADITGKEISVLSEFETTSTGAAMMALLGQKEFGSIEEASDKFARVRMIIRPNPADHEKYLEVYDLFKETYETLKPLFPKRKELIDKLYGKKEVSIENL